MENLKLQNTSIKIWSFVPKIIHALRVFDERAKSIMQAEKKGDRTR